MSAFVAVQYAQRALEIAWDGRLPVDPAAIARNINVYLNDPVSGEPRSIPIEVIESDPFELAGASGEARLDDSNGPLSFKCVFNGFEISYRNRFTIAHELGHVLLGHVNEYNTKKRDTNFSSNTYDPDEISANAFAAALLMPEDKIRDYYRSASSLQQLADAFGVSTAAMSYRLQNLGIYI